MTRRILYLSCHEILEFDEVSILHELGYEVFSPGAYVEPQNRGDQSLRPNIPGLVYDPDILQQWHELASKHPGEDTKDFLSKEFVDNFSDVIVMHLPRWITRNWDAIKHKRVIWRTIGQSISPTENQIKPYREKGLEIIRYSPKERNIPGYIGEDTIIRFYKDPNQYKGWTGERERIINFSQSMKARGAACSYDFFEEVTRPFKRHLFGPGNENTDGWCTGKIPFEQLTEEMRINRAYFYTGTHPASYTLNFMEALMTGIPMVCIGPKHGNASYFTGHDLYEIPDIIQNGINGFISDDKNELQQSIKTLINDYELAKAISKAGRESAIKIFGKDKIMQKWREFLNA